MRKALIFSIFVLIVLIFPVKSTAVSAASAIVIEASTGTVLYEKDADNVRPEASTTKIMTALIALERLKQTDVYTVSARAAAQEGSRIGLLEGQRVSVSDLLYMLLLKSGNDAAVALAEAACGSVERFVAEMNERARALGATSTNFTNPHGMPDENHYTTARELAIIAAKAYENAMFRKITATKTVRLNYMSLVIDNSNRLLELYPPATGIKTGFTKKAGRCLVSSAEKDGITLICVTLNAPDDWNDHIKLYGECFDAVERTMVCRAGEYRIVIPCAGAGESVVAVNTEPVYGVKINGEIPKYTFTENTLPVMFAPIDAGSTAGTLVLSCNGRIVCITPLAVSKTVPPGEEALSFAGRLVMNFLRVLFGSTE